MTVLTHTIIIDTPKPRVYAVLADLEKVADYNPAVVSAHYISQKRVGKGSARECHLGKQGAIRERVTDARENEFIAMELYQHSWPLEYMRWRTQLSETNNATQVNQTLEYRVKFGVFGMLLDKFVMKPKLDRSMQAVFSAMKTYIENEY